ncbi:MAG: four helix bundle protein [Verrucomicrobiota bacterium]|jgi:four helix bundle protein
MATIARFEDLEVWQESRHLVKAVYAATSQGRLAGDFEMRDQMRRAALSTMTNSAEGFERGSNKDFAKFLNIVRGSAGEVRSLLYAALDLGFLDAAAFKLLKEQAESVSRRSSKLIQYLATAAPASRPVTRNLPVASAETVSNLRTREPHDLKT